MCTYIYIYTKDLIPGNISYIYLSYLQVSNSIIISASIILFSFQKQRGLEAVYFISTIFQLLLQP